MAGNLTVEQFAIIWNDTDNFPTIKSIARHTGYKPSAIKSRASKIKKRYQDGKDAPELLNRGNIRKKKPLVTEMRHRYLADITEEQLVQILRDLAIAHEDKVITRNFFRAQTDISDSTWNKYFGTFQEYKRQAGLELTREQHALERQTAKHVSSDHYRDFNTRHNYSDRYNRPNGKKIQTVIGCSDLHDEEIDPFWLRVFIETCKMVQPDVINFGGDIFDLPEFSKFAVDPREWDVVGRIKFVHKNIFLPLREVCPDAQIDFIEGNHEFRLIRHLADATPALKAILSDLLGLTVSSLLGLEEFEINYISKGDLAAFNQGDKNREVEKSYKIYDDTILIHHHPHAKSWGLAGWNGHHHSWKVDHLKNVVNGGYQWLQLGAGHRLRASYTEGEFWSLGFNICHYNRETKSVLHEYVNITDMACVGGVYFTRTAQESIGEFAIRGKGANEKIQKGSSY